MTLSTSYSLEQALEAVNIVAGLSPHSRMKTTTFYELASQAKGGCVIELGAYHGVGTIPIAMGAKEKVYTIDDYVRKNGWAGGYYGPEDEEVFIANTIDLDAVLVKSGVSELANHWAEPASLIIWDLGVRDRMLEDFLAWEKHLIPGGVFAFRDIDNQGLGSRIAVARALALGYKDPKEWPGFVWSVTKV